MRYLGMNQVRWTQTQRRVPLSLGQLAPSDNRVGRETKGADQRQQRLVGDVMRLTKGIGVVCLDADEPSELFDSGTIAHVTAEPTAGERRWR